ncbi:MAG: BtrH N-terminal domain-containing protein [Thermodesulfobacteriota bacterium]
MKKTIDNWVHIPGLHCGSVTLRDVMTHYGYKWSEAMCFGIGGGLGFYYTIKKDTSPSHMIFVRGPMMETTFLSFVDKQTDWKHSSEDVVSMVKKYIDLDVPVVIQTDIYYLDYYNSNTHFPGHIVSVWGYDDESKTIYVADNHLEGLQNVPYENFKQGMASNDLSNPLNNNFIDVRLDKPVDNLEDLIPSAVKENARKMLYGCSGGRGESSVYKIKEWSEDLPNWSDVEDWKWCSRFGYQVIKKRGVCGAGFRWIYRDFLIEAEEIVPLIKELGLAKKMDFIGSKWSDIALLLKEISEKDLPNETLLKTASQKAYELWELESDFYNTVAEKIETE